jgi:hypothetical protein
MSDRHAPDRHAFDHHDERALDELLDRALVSYVDAEPNPSMRARIMARIDNATSPTGRMWLRRIWLPGSVAACVAALLLAFLLQPANHPPEDRVSKAPTNAAAPPPAVSVHLDDTLTHSARPHIVAANRHSFSRRKLAAPPRRSISLASAPLTEEEATLLRFAQQHPEQARQVLSTPPSGPLHTDPVTIAPIQIAALSASQLDAH